MRQMAYNGNITGKDNMKMNVNAGTLTYEGQADVVNVHVARDDIPLPALQLRQDGLHPFLQGR